jgi:hypothetical protein
MKSLLHCLRAFRSRGRILPIAVYSSFLLQVALGGRVALAQTCDPFSVVGDAIGSDSNFTDHTGGFIAQLDQGINLGQPAILVPLTGSELLNELRVIVFGAPTAAGALRFDQFAYYLDIWRAEDYFDEQQPSYRVALGDPSNVGLEIVEANYVVPAVAFGNAGVGGNFATTYDLRFDLTVEGMGGEPILPFGRTLPEGDWVFGIQSHHSLTESGSLRVAGSVAPDGPLPLFSRDDAVPPGILGGQDPENIQIRWAMSLEAELATSSGIPGDFNGDRVVDAADYTVWRDELAPTTGSAGYKCWRVNFGQTTEPQSALTSPQGNDAAALNITIVVPEPTGAFLLLQVILAVLTFNRYAA